MAGDGNGTTFRAVFYRVIEQYHQGVDEGWFIALYEYLGIVWTETVMFLAFARRPISDTAPFTSSRADIDSKAFGSMPLRANPE